LLKAPAEKLLGSTYNMVAYIDVLDSPSSAAAWTAGAVMWNRGDVLYSADPEPCSSKHAYCRLCSWSRGSCLVPARCSNSYVERRYSSILRDAGSRGCGLHGCVGGSLQSICFNVLTSGTPRYRFCAAEIGNVYDGVVERRVDVSNSPSLDRFLLRHL